MSDGEIIILGCGGSGGVPRAGNDWGQCNPNNPRNRRTRPSILIRTAKSNVIIDTGPDFRDQTNREDIKTLDAVLYTHTHTDHTSGIDDIRSFWENQGMKAANKGFPIYADQLTLDNLEKRFSYLFDGVEGLYPKRLHCTVIMDDMMGRILPITSDIAVIPFIQSHGIQGRSLGFRIGNVGYSTDMVDLDDAAIEILQGIDIWIADGNSYYQDVPIVHANKANLLRLAARIKPKMIFLTHLDHWIDSDAFMRDLPDGFAPAYDGQVIPYQV